ncbi:MAG: DNA polymerase III subunit delta [Desulfurivibrionaceae bacterium]|nr:DNA polymerase III subunit delta [Desulfurivibrionaceae bacterium]
MRTIAKGNSTQVYLIFGERYLCRQAADQIVERLLPDEKQRAGGLVLIDGDREEPGQTLNQLRTYSLFGGRRVIRVMDSRLLHSRVVAKSLWEKAVKHYRDNDLEAAGRYLGQVLEIGGMTPADLEELPGAAWKNKLGFPRPQENLRWAVEVLEKKEPAVATSGTGGDLDITELYARAFDEGLPSGNILVLVADAADKRKKFYKYIAEHGSVVDLSVDSGTNKAAADSRNEVLTEIIRTTLAGFDKKIEPRVLATFLDRVGFHPVAAALESEKLALYVDERERITIDDLNQVIGRTREEAVYELSEAFSDRDLPKTLAITGRLLESGLHPLVIVAALRNHLKKMLLVSSLRDLDNPSYAPGLSFPAFKGGYLDRLKEEQPDWPKELPGHPYALYMMFRKVEKFQTPSLIKKLSELLEAEYRLKSSGLPEKIVLENMFFRLLAPGRAR